MAPHPQPATGSRPRRRLPPGSAASAPAARRDPTRCDSGAIASIPPLPRAGQGAGTPLHSPGRSPSPSAPRRQPPAPAPQLRVPPASHLGGGRGASAAGTRPWGHPPRSPVHAPCPSPLRPTAHSGSPAGSSPPNLGRAAAPGQGPGTALPVPAPVPVPVPGSGEAAGLPVSSGTKPRLFAEGTAARDRLLMRPGPAGVPALAWVPVPAGVPGSDGSHHKSTSQQPRLCGSRHGPGSPRWACGTAAAAGRHDSPGVHPIPILPDSISTLAESIPTLAGVHLHPRRVHPHPRRTPSPPSPSPSPPSPGSISTLAESIPTLAGVHLPPRRGPSPPPSGSVPARPRLGGSLRCQAPRWLSARCGDTGAGGRQQPRDRHPPAPVTHAPAPRLCGAAW
ncbi:PREDICTED: skin secretory protein xP2-like [Lepidothrix coronata]|uniref:Skin secretory protein xP2-like n=1 Tax=Lepidothrix coronata TaxID=321398 RepID=A0A6J0J554_9PASS|nr:PREDICTED: skin secretory protein xP2-like [Lepidothrix coronata]